MAGAAAKVPSIWDLLTAGAFNPREVLELLDTRPEAASERNSQGSLPLISLAALSDAAVLRRLLELFPAAAKTPDAAWNGGLPLHRALRNGLPLSIIRLLVEAAPDTAAMPVSRKMTAMHWAAVATPASAETIEFIAAAAPDAALAADMYGQTPLHHAALEGTVAAEPLRALIAAGPEALMAQDRWGQVPLHNFSTKAGPDTLRIIVEACPEALGVAATGNNGQLPVGESYLLPDGRVDSAQYLMHFLLSQELAPAPVASAAAPPAAPAADASAGTPATAAATTTDAAAPPPPPAAPAKAQLNPRSPAAISWMSLLRDGKDNFAAVVEEMLEAFPLHAADLALMSDEHGRRAIDVATPKCKVALLRRLYLCGRYEVPDAPPEHASGTSIVYRALDHLTQGPGGRPTHVILKFMRRHADFARELAGRAMLQVRKPAVAVDGDGDETAAPATGGAAATPATASATAGASADASDIMNEYVVPVLRSHSDATDAGFAGQLAAQRYATHPYLVVLEAGDRSLAHIIDAERALPRWPAECRRITYQLAEALAAVHARGVAHCDIKPRNVVRVGVHYKLIDLDAAVPVDGTTPAGAKLSTAFAPPELLRAKRAAVPAAGGGGGDGRDAIPFPAATTAMDAFGLGLLLFQLLRGSTLTHADAFDNAVHDSGEQVMAEWTDDVKVVHLKCIDDAAARHLLSMLLYADPARRPTMRAVLEHPFVTGRKAVRLPGAGPAPYDVFLSYRVASDAHIVAALFERLTAAGVRVWWDRVCLKDGFEWRDGFCDGLVNARLFLPIISLAAVGGADARCNWSMLQEGSPCDNVLLEHRLALELHARGVTELVMPVFVGQPSPTDSRDDGEAHQPFFASPPATPSDVIVSSVESALRYHLDRCALGTPLVEALSPRSVWQAITAFQGVEFKGQRDAALAATVARVVAAVAEASAAVGGGTAAGVAPAAASP